MWCGEGASWQIQLFYFPLETGLRGDFCARDCQGKHLSITCHKVFVLVVGFDIL